MENYYVENILLLPSKKSKLDYNCDKNLIIAKYFKTFNLPIIIKIFYRKFFFL